MLILYNLKNEGHSKGVSLDKLHTEESLNQEELLAYYNTNKNIKHIMNKEIAKELNLNNSAKLYSNKEREGNFNNEEFKVKEAIPTSDHTATDNGKNTGKLAAYFLLY